MMTQSLDKILNDSIGHRPQQRFSELKPFLEFIIKRRSLISALEIGSADGGLTYILSELFKWVVAVDINHTANYNKPNIIRVGPDSDIIKDYAPYSLIFIDGDHTYDSVKADYYKYSEYLNDVIAFHDVKDTWVQKRDKCEVRRFIDEGHLLGFKNSMEFIEFTDEWGGQHNPEMKDHGGLKIWWNYV